MPAHVPTASSARVNAPWLDSLGALGWREIVLLLAALLGFYVLFVFLRLRRIGRPPAIPVEPQLIPPVLSPPAQAPAAPAESAPATAPEAASEPVRRAPPEPEDLPWVRTPEQRDERRRLEVIESEIVSMRCQIESLSETVAMLVDELRRDYEHQYLHPSEAGGAAAGMEVAARPAASPLYGDAMELALAGHDAATIAERCGIARAEADLVVALAEQAADKVNEAAGGQASERGGGGDGGQGRY